MSPDHHACIYRESHIVNGGLTCYTAETDACLVGEDVDCAAADLQVADAASATDISDYAAGKGGAVERVGFKIVRVVI